MIPRWLQRHWRLITTLAGLAVLAVPVFAGTHVLVLMICLVVAGLLIFAGAVVDAIEVTR